MNQPITAEDLLRLGRAILTPPGRWIKNDMNLTSFDHPEPEVCVAGAIIVARVRLGLDTDNKAEVEAYERLAEAMPEEFQQPAEGCIARYNDDPETSHEDVLKLFDRAIGGK